MPTVARAGATKNNAEPEAERVGSDRLTEILDASVKLFFQRGYAGTDLRAIADEVGLHVSSLYNHIQSKEEVLYIITLDCTERGLAALDCALEGVEDPIDRLRAAIKAQVKFHAENAKLALTAHTDNRLLTGAYKDRILELGNLYRDRRMQLIEDAVLAGRVRSVNVFAATEGIMGMARTVARWYEPTGPVTPDELADLYADICLAGLMTPSH